MGWSKAARPAGALGRANYDFIPRLALPLIKLYLLNWVIGVKHSKINPRQALTNGLLWTLYSFLGVVPVAPNLQAFGNAATVGDLSG